jgi:hypothetical protein
MGKRQLSVHNIMQGLKVGPEDIDYYMHIYINIYHTYINIYL